MALPSENDQSTAQVAQVPQEVTGLTRHVVVGGVTWRDTFAALKHRNFRLFFIGQLVSLTGSWVQNTAQGWLVYQMTGSKVLLGTVAAVGSLPMLLLLSVWGGSVADRHSKSDDAHLRDEPVLGIGSLVLSSPRSKRPMGAGTMIFLVALANAQVNFPT